MNRDAGLATASASGSSVAVRVRAFWSGLPPRERALVLGAAVLVGVTLAWVVGLQPALRTLRAVPPQMAAVDLQLQQMQRLAAEARELRALPPLPAGQAVTALRQTTATLGEQARLSLVGDRASVALTGVSTSALRDWLAATRTAARARPVEASLTRSEQGWSGTVVLQIGGTP
jgi:general secretion pathway protein M